MNEDDFVTCTVWFLICLFGTSFAALLFEFLSDVITTGIDYIINLF